MGESSPVTLRQRAADKISGHEPTVARRVAPIISSRVSDMSTEAPVPPGYRIAHLLADGERSTSEVTGVPPRWDNRESAGYSSFDTTFAPPNVPELFQVASNSL